jgi:hypothetical protein
MRFQNQIGDAASWGMISLPLSRYETRNANNANKYPKSKQFYITRRDRNAAARNLLALLAFRDLLRGAIPKPKLRSSVTGK